MSSYFCIMRILNQVTTNEMGNQVRSIGYDKGKDRMTRIPAYISTVDATRTIVLPDSIPVGAKVAVMVMPEEITEDDPGRRARFEQVMKAVEVAMAEGYSPPKISDAELDARIERARRTTEP